MESMRRDDPDSKMAKGGRNQRESRVVERRHQLRRCDRFYLCRSDRLPNIYRKYYGPRMAGFLFVTFYASMAAAALLVELLFAALGLIPEQRNALVVEATIAWNYTTGLNTAFLVLAAYLV